MKAADSLIILRQDQWHGLSKQNARSTGEKFLIRNARFRNLGQMEKSRPNHKINGNSGSPKLLIQANDGQNSELVYWIRSIRRCSAQRKGYGDNCESIYLH